MIYQLPAHVKDVWLMSRSTVEEQTMINIFVMYSASFESHLQICTFLTAFSHRKIKDKLVDNGVLVRSN